MFAMPTIVVDDEGVWCHDPGKARSGIRWDEIVRVTAGKIDAVTEVDTTIELDFEFGEYLSLNSAFPGFSEAAKQICDRLPGVSPQWSEQIQRLCPGDQPIVLWSRQAVT
jgi:hypothetical protein